MILRAYFADSGAPKTGLSPTIDVYESDGGAQVVSAGAMTETGGGFYVYDFAAWDSSKEYDYICDGSAVLSGNERYAVGSVDPLTYLATILEGSVTVRHALTAIIAMTSGKVSGGGTTSVKYRNQADTIDRIILTVDSNGDRSSTVLDFSDL